MLGDSAREWQAQAVAWASYLHIGSVVVVALALGWIYYEAHNDTVLSAELGDQKRSAGLLIAGVALAGALITGFHLQSDGVGNALLIIVCSAGLWLLACAATLLLRYGMQDLDEHLQTLFQARSLLFRVALLNLMTMHSILLAVLSADRLDSLWSAFSPFANSGTPFLACMLGVVAPFALNLIVPFQIANARLHHNLRTNSLERLLYRAAVETTLVQVTLKDGKVYVGWVDRLPPDPASPDAYLQLLPITSGYRDKDTKTITFTTHYDQIYEQEDVEPSDFMKVVPIANIDSAGHFREDVYLHFVKRNEPESDTDDVDPDAPEPPTTKAVA